MCLIFISIHQHPRYKLVLASNRDEFYARRTQAADFWTEHPDMLAGKDLEAGGTWMGVTRAGKVSLVTNYRDLRNLKTKAPSRGHLVSDYLQNEVNAEGYLEKVEEKGNLYNGFNLLAGTVDELWYFSNYGSKPEKLSAGIHGLSNHLLDTPWPKVKRGKEHFLRLLQKSSINPGEVFDFLYDEEQATDDLLPDTGVGIERERMLSSMFIKSPGYGSRCSTLVLVDQRNHLFFSERVYNIQTFDYETRNFEFDVTPKGQGGTH